MLPPEPSAKPDCGSTCPSYPTGRRLVKVYGACTADREHVCLIMEVRGAGVGVGLHWGLHLPACGMAAAVCCQYYFSLELLAELSLPRPFCS